MAQKTIFQKLTDVVIGTGNGTMSTPHNVSNYTILPNKEVLYSFDNKAERDEKLQTLRQQKLLAHQWAKSGYETSMEQLAGATQVKVMYRDADLMAAWPEIGAALDIISEEATTLNEKGKMLNIYSKSNRIKSILEDLFVNRLDIHVMLPLIIRSTCKYGNDFMMLKIDEKNGITGWRELPVYNMKRVENGMLNGSGGYGGAAISTAVNHLKPDEVQFVWEGHNEQIAYRNWQIAHFRLIKDSIYLPYGVSWLNKARRHWRMLSMMEDAMLLYRLERSIERRIFKVNVGTIDEADVPAFLQEFMNNVKRAPIIDPQTGQMDLRKNFLDVSADYVIPVRNQQDPTSIETLQAAQNTTSMDDIKYMQEKVLSALRIPKTFLNFQENQGKGQNLSIMDIRFNRTVNSVQQSILMELNKIAIIHLYLLGFDDELTNFTLTMNNPSNQIEMMQLENMARRLESASNALSEQGGGLPIMSWHQVQKEIMGKNDSEITEMLNEIRVEMALAMELQQTNQIIKRTGLFNQADRIYGEPGAKYSENPQGDEEGGMGDFGGGGGGGFSGGMGGDFGGGLDDLGEPGEDIGAGDIGGNEGSADLGDMPMESNGGQKGVLTEEKKGNLSYFNEYMNLLNKKKPENINERVSIVDKAFLINEELNQTIKDLENKENDKVNFDLDKIFIDKSES